jgi:hypothetical protein
MESRRTLWIVLIGAIALIGIAVRVSPAQEELDSLKVCSKTQKLILENRFVRVIDDRIPVGVSEPKHRHPHGVTIALTDYDIESKPYPNGKVSKSHRKNGEVNWTEATVHEVHNVGTTDSHAVRIELKY